jgi:sulfofructose kinase
MRFPFQLLPTNDFDVVGFGTNAVDYLIRVPEYPPFNSKVELSGYSIEAGGEIASSMAGLARLGMRAAYVGRFGGDQAGEIGLSSLVAEGVDTTYAETVSDARTQVAFILVDERSGERTVIWQRDKQLAYSAADVPVEAAIRGRLLHMTPHDTAACVRLARSAKESGVVVSLDVDNVFDGIDKLLTLVDICIGSSDFPEKLF